METIHLAHMPQGLELYASLYRDVENGAFLKEQLLAGNTDFEYAFIDASTVLSRKHALSAAFRAMNDYIHDRLKSRNIHSEIVFALSPNNNIGEAFRRFGIGDTTRDLLVFKVATQTNITADSVEAHLRDQIKGRQVPFDNEHLKQIVDIARVRKIYKLPTASKQSAKLPINGTDHAAVDEIAELEVQATGLMILRGAT